MDFQPRTSEKPVPSQRSQWMLFARNFFKHPRMLGSIIPSSGFLVRRLLDQADWENARVIVEYGPGVGTITREILARMHPEARLIVVETNEDFVDFLNETLFDPRLDVIHDSAENVADILSDHGLGAADHVVAGLPFSTMPDELRVSLFEGSQQALKPTGSMLIYQFSPKAKADLMRIFSQVRSDFEPLNVPPAHCYFCTP